MDIAQAVEQESDTRVNSPERLSFLLSVVINGFLKVGVSLQKKWHIGCELITDTISVCVFHGQVAHM